MSERAFVVTREDLGRSEAEWESSRSLGALPSLAVPPARRAIVIAPHPDDEVLGAGGLLQVLTDRGVAVDVCAVTDGEASWGALDPGTADRLRRLRTTESERAAARLGLDPRRHHRLGVADGEVGIQASVLDGWLTESLTADALVIAPWSEDGHPDHDASGRIAAAAAASAGVPLLRYLVWAWHWASPNGVDIPWLSARRLTLTRRQVARKRGAIAAFGSQIRTPVAGPGSLPVLPPEVLLRFRRPWEVYLT